MSTPNTISSQSPQASPVTRDRAKSPAGIRTAKTRGSLARVVFVVAVALVLAACSGEDQGTGAVQQEEAPEVAETTEGTTSTSLETTTTTIETDDITDAQVEDLTVRVSVPPFGSQAFVLDMIDQQGIGERHGITIERVPFSGPPTHYLHITGDVSDVAAATWLELQQNQARGLRVIGVGPNLRYVNPLVVGADSGIESIEDLKGKRIGVYFQAGTDVLAARAAIIEQYGFDYFEENEILSADAPLLDDQLRRGEIDAAFTFSNFAAGLVADGAGETLFVTADLLNEVFGIDPDAPFGVYITSARVVNEQPEKLERFLAAYVDAVEVLQTDDSVWPALAESRGVTDPDAVAEFMASERNGFATAWNQETIENFEEIFNILLDIGGEELTGIAEFDATTYTTEFWPGD